MGEDKAALPMGGETMLGRVLRLVSPFVSETILTAAPGQVMPAGHRVQRDDAPGEGPLPGLLAAAGLLTSSHVFVVACDTPLLEPQLIPLLDQRCEGWDAAVPLIDGRRAAACAVYRTAALVESARLVPDPRHGSLQGVLGGLRVRDVLASELREVDPELLSFQPCNTPEDYAHAWRRVATEHATPPLASLLDADGPAAAGHDEGRWFDFVEHVMETLDAGPGTSVWDAGCGVGAFLYPLHVNGYRVGGMDRSAARIALARSAMPTGRFESGNPVQLDPTEPWSVVVASHGLEGCRDLDEVRALLARMTAKATHAVALLQVDEDGQLAVGRAEILRALVDAGASAVRFEQGPGGRLHVFASVSGIRA